MRKHLYFNSSNLDYIEEINSDLAFEPFYQYPKHELSQCTPYEWGRIKTPSLYIHLIMGNPLKKNCPWCDCGVGLIKLNEDNPSNPSNPFHKLQFCMQCQNCGSRGPILNISADYFFKEHQQHFRSMIESIYSQRKSWDSDKFFEVKNEMDS